MSTVETGKGTRRLLKVVETEITHTTEMSKALEYETHRCTLDFNRAKLLNIYHKFAQTDAQTELSEVNADIFQDQGAFITALKSRADTLVKELKVVQKLGKSILSAQEQHGAQVIKTADGLARLTVGFKCLDGIWGDAVMEWREIFVDLVDYRNKQVIFNPQSKLFFGENVDLEKLERLDAAERDLMLPLALAAAKAVAAMTALSMEDDPKSRATVLSNAIEKAELPDDAETTTTPDDHSDEKKLMEKAELPDEVETTTTPDKDSDEKNGTATIKDDQPKEEAAKVVVGDDGTVAENPKEDQEKSVDPDETESDESVEEAKSV
jgi:hypothetical protein